MYQISSPKIEILRPGRKCKRTLRSYLLSLVTLVPINNVTFVHGERRVQEHPLKMTTTKGYDRNALLVDPSDFFYRSLGPT